MKASAGMAGIAVTGPALAETLADVPPRELGAPLGGHSDRSRYVQISRIPEAGPGIRNVDPSDAINSKTPLNKLIGVITPSDLHYERSHSGVPDLDPAKHRLLIHGLVEKPLALTADDLMAMPAVSRVRPMPRRCLTTFDEPCLILRRARSAPMIPMRSPPTY